MELQDKDCSGFMHSDMHESTLDNRSLAKKLVDQLFAGHHHQTVLSPRRRHRPMTAISGSSVINSTGGLSGELRS